MKKIMVLAACLALLAAGAAQAATTTTNSFSVDLLSPPAGYTPTIYMLNNTSAFTATGGGPMVNSSLYGQPLTYLYCLNPERYLYDKDYDYSAISDSGAIYGSALPNANKIAYLLWNYGAKATGDEARGLQAAIWNLVDSRYTLDSAPSGALVTDYYQDFLGYVTSYSAIDLIDNFYWITPGETVADITGFAYQAVVAPTPIPGTVMLFGSGLAGLVGIARFRRKRSAD